MKASGFTTEIIVRNNRGLVVVRVLTESFGEVTADLSPMPIVSLDAKRMLRGFAYLPNVVKAGE